MCRFAYLALSGVVGDKYQCTALIATLRFTFCFASNLVLSQLIRHAQSQALFLIAIHSIAFGFTVHSLGPLHLRHASEANQKDNCKGIKDQEEIQPFS